MINWLDSEEPSSGQSEVEGKAKHGSAKHKFTPEEDEILSDLANKHAKEKIQWTHIAKSLPGRTPRQCRERWINFLDPSINRDPWTESEMSLLCEKYKEFGPSWSKLAQFFKGRTDVFLKNKWVQFKRKMKKRQVDSFKSSSYFNKQLKGQKQVVQRANTQTEGFKAKLALPPFSNFDDYYFSLDPLEKLCSDSYFQFSNEF